MLAGQRHMSGIDTRLGTLLQGCEVSGPVSAEEIEAAQEALGLVFPPSYRYFLAKYGAALGAGFYIAGLSHESLGPDDTPMWSNVVRDTMRYRPNSLPENSIAISHDGAEFGYFLCCSRSDSGYEGPVIEWGPAHDGGVEFASDFVAFVEVLRRR